jgi:Cdc6-like AAA superfamily ATPase
MTKTAFFAYPKNRHLDEVIIRAADHCKKESGYFVTPWQTIEIAGFQLDKLIRDRVRKSEVLFADVTFANFNVYYEIGYALASKRPVIPTVYTAIEEHKREVRLTGIFDTIGYLEYNNSSELSEKIVKENAPHWIEDVIEKRNHNQPLFFLDTFVKTDFRNQLRQTIDNSKVQCRSFDPSESPRLSAPNAVKLIAASTGVVLPLLSPDIRDSRLHNLRAAFLAGLSHGFELEPLIIQWDRDPAPLDFADFVTNVNRNIEVAQKVSDYCAKTLIENQKRAKPLEQKHKSLLGEIDIGASAAENEVQSLEDYFVETAEFSRALRSKSSLVVGRKGTGKSAIYQVVSQRKLSNRRNVVVDLNPASHSLSELREQLLKVMDHGVFDHSINGFWQYIIYSEIIMAIREKLLPKAKYNHDYQKIIKNIEIDLGLTEEMAEGDFTSRFNAALHSLIEYVRNYKGTISAKQLTNILFKNDIRKLRDVVISVEKEFDEIVLLFDNIDKGWPAKGVQTYDIRIVRLLIEGLEIIQNDIGRAKEIDFSFLVFLRSDVFELLVKETSDRGKYNIIRVDWSDPMQLRNLLFKRLTIDASTDAEKLEIWNAIVPEQSSSRDKMFETMLDRCLMRPRFLIDLCERAISIAINRGHTKVEFEDMQQALRQHSNYLVSDFIYEIRDVSSIDENIFYNFLGKGELFTKSELEPLLSSQSAELDFKNCLDLLLWFGFIGIAKTDEDRIYIYSVEYDQRRLEAIATNMGEDVLYCVNPAFLEGLN